MSTTTEETLNINSATMEGYPTLVNLIKTTESMNQVEKQDWFKMIASGTMTTVQIDRLQEILQVEKDKLDALDKKYEENILDLNNKLNLK